MRRRFLLPAFLSLLSLPAIASPDEKLIVHEWGTFTSFAGSNGNYLDYRTRVGGDLPDFVLDRTRQDNVSVAKPAGPPDAELFLKDRVYTLSRMETPVTYFYTDAPMKVHAKVDFPKGILTEFYPPVAKMTPLVTQEEKSGKTAPAARDGMLDWGELLLTPAGAAVDTSKMPAVSQSDRYAAARETDSDIVQSTDPAGAVHQEKFLFYRGICNIDLPLRLKSVGHDRFELSDPGKTPIATAFLVQVEGSKVRFARYEKINGPRALALPVAQTSLDALSDAMAKDLIATGLYEKEARAMVATWRTSWFGEDGTRVLYLMPQTLADNVLPLKITPKPQQTLRVMVGRLEAMTPEREHDLADRLASGAEIKDLGRFGEPSLRRIAEMTKDAAVKAKAEAMLAKMRP